MNSTHRFSVSLLAFAAMALGAGCDNPEAMLKEQADLVCACDTFECGMGVLEGPINQKLKEMDKGGSVELTDTAREHKKRMMGCLLELKTQAVGAASPTGETKPTAAPAAEPFTSSEGKFSAKFPFGKPQEKVSPDHKKIEWKETKATTGMYNVSYADFATPALAQAYVDDYLKTMASKLTSNDEVTTGATKGREVVMKVSETASMWLRLFVVDKRVFKVAAGTKNDKAKAYEFLDSFALVP